jgi:CheY-like chemotaxis protein
MTGRILLVDDEPLLRRAFRALLEASGYEVSEAGSAGEALEKAKAESPALVFLDLGLPDRSGIEVAREITQNPDVRVVAITGRSEPGLIRACREAGCTDHLIKPVSPAQLVSGIPGWLSGPATGGPEGTPA